jgi:uncharacterized protein (TIGR00369 family)
MPTDSAPDDLAALYAGAEPIAPADLASLPGIELMRGMMEGRFPAPPIAALFSMRPTEIADGLVVFEAVPERRHYNPIGTVHGGFAATVLDSCMGCAVHTTLAAGFGYTTVDLQITYVKAATDKTGPVTARGEIISRGRRVATAQGRLFDATGRLLAHGTTTCLVFPVGEAARRG